MRYSIEIGVGDAFFFVAEDGSGLSPSPIYMEEETMAKILSTFDWASAVESQPKFVIRAEGEDKPRFSVDVGAPDILIRAIMLAGNMYVVSRDNHRKMFWDNNHNWWVVLEEKPGHRSPKVIHRTTNIELATMYLLGEEDD